jgi:hypothetical protein
MYNFLAKVMRDDLGSWSSHFLGDDSVVHVIDVWLEVGLCVDI